jgi:DNA-binding transcriptional LysR family regulator
MKTHLLKYFVVLAEELHFGRAAQKLSMTQPPLSTAIRQLEEDLGVDLFYRDNKRVRLTPAGNAFLSEAQAILNRMDRASEIARGAADGLLGRIDVGFTGSMLYRDLPRVVAAFNEQHPRMEVILHELSTAEQIEALKRRQLQAGFINIKEPAAGTSGLRHITLREEPLVCCLPQSHPLADKDGLNLKQLENDPFVMVAREAAPTNHDNVISTLHRAGVNPKRRHAARQWLTVVAMVGAGMGVSLVPASMRTAQISGTKFVPIKGQRSSSSAMLAWNPEQNSFIVDAFVRLAQEVIVEESSGSIQV